VSGPDHDSTPVWSPDGSQLAFWSRPSGGSVQLAIVDADGTEVGRFDPPTTGSQWPGYTNGETNIDWGPMDGRIMTRTAPDGPLWLLDTRDGSAEPVTLGDRTSRVNDFDWSDDGTKLAFVSWDDAPHYEYVFVADLGGSEPRQLVKADPVDGSLASVRWDHDGTRLTYTKGLDDPSYDGNEPGQLQRTITNLYVLDVASGEQREVRPGRFYMPDWSPSGDRIAYGAQDVIGVINADGSDPVTLGITNVSVSDIIWSPDGTKVASVAGGTDPDWRVVTMDAAGGIPTYIDAPGMVAGPSWQPILGAS
jgi:Tol biopolymer transport system component